MENNKHIMDDDAEIGQWLAKLAVPEPASNLEHRILLAAHMQKRPKTALESAQEWLNNIGHVLKQPFAQPRPAYAYAMAAFLVIAAGIASAPFLKTTPESEQEIAYQRYTVDGVPLLDDVALVQESYIIFDQEQQTL